MSLKEIMKEAGIVGSGGAGFPSYAKLADGADTLVINGAECERNAQGVGGDKKRIRVR